MVWICGFFLLQFLAKLVSHHFHISLKNCFFDKTCVLVYPRSKRFGKKLVVNLKAVAFWPLVIKQSHVFKYCLEWCFKNLRTPKLLCVKPTTAHANWLERGILPATPVNLWSVSFPVVRQKWQGVLLVCIKLVCPEPRDWPQTAKAKETTRVKHQLGPCLKSRRRFYELSSSTLDPCRNVQCNISHCKEVFFIWSHDVP